MRQGLEVKVWRDYDAFLRELGDGFPAERAGIKRFYDECWRVFDALNSLELKSLEEPRYLLTQFARHPVACLTLASFLATNTGDVARRHIKARQSLTTMACTSDVYIAQLQYRPPLGSSPLSPPGSV